jgi:hypothetical protein
LIEGRFHPEANEPLPLVVAYVQITGIAENWTPIELLIDTGAAVTCVYPVDATRRFGIAAADLSSPGDWQHVDRKRGVGGEANFFVVQATYAFRHADSNFQFLQGELRIAELSDESAVLPSILGWDVMKHFRLTADWNKRLVTLE